MAVRYFFDDVKAWIELVDKRTYHVQTPTGGYDKTVLTYEFTCRWCGVTGRSQTIEAVKRLAAKHTATHPDLTKQTITST